MLVLRVEVIVAWCALAVKQGAQVESNNLPFILVSCPLYSHDKGKERACTRINQQTSSQLKHIGSVQDLSTETVTAIMGNPKDNHKIECHDEIIFYNKMT